MSDRAVALAFREREFRRFYGGFVTFAFSQSMLRFLLPWLAYEISRSTVVLGLTGLAIGGLQAGLSPLGGVWADRVDVRSVIRLTQASAATLALILSALVLSGRVEVWSLVLLAAGFGACFAFDQPARQALLPMLMTPVGLPGATSLVGMSWSVAGIVSPGIAAAALAVLLSSGVGPWPLFLLVAVGYLGLTFTIAGVTVRARTVAARRHWWHEIKEGVAFTLRERIPRSMVLLTLANALLGASYILLMPAFAHDVYHSDVTGLGLLVASVGAGGVLGAAVLGLSRSTRHRGAIALASSFVLGLELVVFGATSWLPAGVALAALGGAANTVGFVVALTLVQNVVPANLYGRTLGLLAVSASVGPLGAALLGTMAAAVGVQRAVSLAGVCLVVVSVVVWRGAPELADDPTASGAHVKELANR